MATNTSLFANAPQPPVFKDKLEERAWMKFRLAQAYRIFGRRGYGDGISGHITVRDPIKPDCFWVNPWGVNFNLIQAEDLLLVDHAGNIVESGNIAMLNRAAYMIHSKIHGARSDVLCAAHTHSIYGKSFSALGKPLDPISQDACAFYNDHTLYTEYNGVVLDEEEGEAIAVALGQKKAVILQNHGLLIAASSIEATVYFYIAMEKACQAQLLADAAGETKKITTLQAQDTWSKVGTQWVGWFSGLVEFQLLEAKEGKSFQFLNNDKL